MIVVFRCLYFLVSYVGFALPGILFGSLICWLRKKWCLPSLPNYVTALLITVLFSPVMVAHPHAVIFVPTHILFILFLKYLSDGVRISQIITEDHFQFYGSTAAPYTFLAYSVPVMASLSFALLTFASHRKAGLHSAKDDIIQE